MNSHKVEAVPAQLGVTSTSMILEAFVVQYNARGESSTVALMTDIGVSDGGTPSDPAQIYDCINVASAILRDETLLEERASAWPARLDMPIAPKAFELSNGELGR